MARTIGDVLIRIGASSRVLEADLKKMEKSLMATSRKFQDIGSRMTEGITLPLAGLGAAALKAFADMEKLQKGMTAIMGSAELAADEIERLREVAKLPGLGLKEAVQGSVNLQAVGFSADEARSTLMGFGKALAATGKGKFELEAIQYQLTQMISKNRILAEDFKVIQSNLPLMSKGMKAAFGTSNIEAVRATGISAKDFVIQLTDALSKLPETQKVTGGLSNAFENLGDSVFIALSELGDTINESLQLEKVFNAVSDGLNRFVEGFKQLKPEVRDFIVKAVLILAAIGPISFVIGKVIAAVGGLISIFGSLVGMIKLVAAAFAATSPFLLILDGIFIALGLASVYVYENWDAFRTNFYNIWVDIQNYVGKSIAGIFKSLDELQRRLGVDLFDFSNLTSFNEKQKIVATEFKTIGQTVDSLKTKLGNLFFNAPKNKTKADDIIVVDDDEDEKDLTGDKKKKKFDVEILQLEALSDNLTDVQFEFAKLENSFVNGLINPTELASGKIQILKTALQELSDAGFDSTNKKVAELQQTLTKLIGPQFNIKGQLPDDETVDIMTELNKEIAIIQDKTKYGLLSQTDADLARVDALKQALQTLITQGLGGSDLANKISEAINSAGTAVKEGFTDIFDYLNRQVKKGLGDNLKNVAGAIGTAFETVSTIFDLQEQKLDEYEKKQRAAIESGYYSEEQKKKAVEKLEEDLAKKRSALARKRAMADKAQAIFSATVNTASAVVQALPNVALAAIIGVLGAAQIAAIAAAPIPALAIGTDRVKSDGMAYLHKGEAVVPADVVAGGFSGSNGTQIYGRLSGIDLLLSNQYAGGYYNRLR